MRSMLSEDYVDGRAIYLQGSILITKDQERCKLKEASIRPNRNSVCSRCEKGSSNNNYLLASGDRPHAQREVLHPIHLHE